MILDFFNVDSEIYRICDCVRLRFFEYMILLSSASGTDFVFVSAEHEVRGQWRSNTEAVASLASVLL